MRQARYASRIAFCVLFLALTLSACGPKSTGPQPPEIVYGQDLCDECGMIIDDARFAAATLLADGRALKFDDISDMIMHHMDHPEDQATAWFVHDYTGGHWIRGETAYFVKSDRLKTPMGGGVAAFENQADAEAFAAEMDGKIYTLDELRAAVHEAAHG